MIEIKGDLRRADLALLEGYVRGLVEEGTGPVARVVYHGVVKQDLARVREELSAQDNRRRRA